MVSKTMVVKAAEGLHMRPAGVIAREAGKFDWRIGWRELLYEESI